MWRNGKIWYPRIWVEWLIWFVTWWCNCHIGLMKERLEHLMCLWCHFVKTNKSQSSYMRRYHTFPEKSINKKKINSLWRENIDWRGILCLHSHNTFTHIIKIILDIYETIHIYVYWYLLSSIFIIFCNIYIHCTMFIYNVFRTN